MKTFTGHRGVKFASGVCLMDPRVAGCLDEEREQEGDDGRGVKRRKVVHGGRGEVDEQRPTTTMPGGSDSIALATDGTTTSPVDQNSSTVAPDTISSASAPVPAPVLVPDSAAIDAAIEEADGGAGDQGGNGDGDGGADAGNATAAVVAESEVLPISIPISMEAEVRSEPMTGSAVVNENGDGNANESQTHTRDQNQNGSETPTESRMEAENIVQNDADDDDNDGIPTAWLLSGTDTEDVFLWDVQSRQCLQRIHTQNYDLSDMARVELPVKGDGVDVPRGDGAAGEAEDRTGGEGKRGKDKDAAGREDRPTLALAAHPWRREIAVGGVGGRWGNVVSVWRSR